jgi:hypothetical protein
LDRSDAVTDQKKSPEKKPSKPAGPAKAAQRRKKGWQAGQSGNPKGRPPGSLNKTTIFAKEIAQEKLGEVIDALHNAAVVDGNVQAQKYLVSLFVPPARSQPIQIELPPIRTPNDIVAAFDAIWAAVGAGEITLDDMDRLRGFLEAKLKAIEVVELAEDLELIKAEKEYRK